jgi:hypothetical protein
LWETLYHSANSYTRIPKIWHIDLLQYSVTGLMSEGKLFSNKPDCEGVKYKYHCEMEESRWCDTQRL